MSVWKKVSSSAVAKDVKLNILEKALAEMNLSLNKNVRILRNGYGSSQCFAAIVNPQGKTTDVGINFTKDNGLEIVGDLWGSGLNYKDGGHQQLLDTIAQHYQVSHITTKATEQLYTVSTKKVNNKIEIELVRY